MDARDRSPGAPGASLPSVLAALAANLAIASAKGIAAALTGSSALFAETLHSVADAGNEAFLLVALRRSSRPADAEHPFGYGAERFYWALLAALGMFVVGSGVAIWQGVHALLHPPEIEAFWVGVVVLVVSIVLDGSSRMVAGREVRSRAARRSISLRQYLGEASDPTVTTVFLEDTADVIGAVLALTALVLHQLTGAALPDALASLAIGALLAYVALRLAGRNRELLTNRAIPQRYLDELSRLITEEPGVRAVVGLQGIYLGPAAVLITGDVHLEAALDASAAGDTMVRLRDRVRARYPDVAAEVYLMPVAEAVS
jgi:cation diffusion facilitator family transporter